MFSRSPFLLWVGSLALVASGCGAPQAAATVPAPATDAAAPETLPTDVGGDAGPVAVTPASPDPPEPPPGEDKDEVDDGAEDSVAEGQGQVYKHPLDTWSRDQIEAALTKDPESLGSMSIGYTNSGALYNGVQMPSDEAWNLVNPEHAWGTKETVDFLSRCLHRVSTELPGAAKIYIGHISGRRGGHLSPHKSHQAGRDVDLSYYYLPGQEKWYATANANNLDRERTWAFIKALASDTDVELILIDRSVQRLLRQFAVAHGDDRAWVDQLFDGGGGLRPLILHAKGHATHIHVRFYNPLAQETGRRAYDLLIKQRILQPPTYFVTFKAKSGDTLSEIAQKYGVTQKVVQQTNGLKNDVLKIGREYKIPRHGGVKACPRAIIPPRRPCPATTEALPQARTPALPQAGSNSAPRTPPAVAPAAD